MREISHIPLWIASEMKLYKVFGNIIVKKHLFSIKDVHEAD